MASSTLREEAQKGLQETPLVRLGMLCAQLVHRVRRPMRGTAGGR